MRGVFTNIGSVTVHGFARVHGGDRTAGAPVIRESRPSQTFSEGKTAPLRALSPDPAFLPTVLASAVSGLAFPSTGRLLVRADDQIGKAILTFFHRLGAWKCIMPAASAAEYEGKARRFESTCWTDILKAREDEQPEGQKALERLCRTYWLPIHNYIRGRGYSPDDAKDLTQSFFSVLLQRRALDRVGPDRGRFRTFLLRALDNFLSDDWHRARRLKRGGGELPVSLGGEDNAESPALQAAVPAVAEVEFDRQWARTTMDCALERLRAEFDGGGQVRRFDLLKAYLHGDGGDGRYQTLAEQLGVSEGTIKSAIHRLRQRFGQMLREVIAETLDDPRYVEEELRALCFVLRH